MMLVSCVLFIVILCRRSFCDQVNAKGLPPPPSISSQDVYMAEHPISVTCSLYKDHEKKLVRFYRNEQKILSVESSSGNITLHIDASLPWSDGKYRCDYQIKRLGRWIDSLSSGNLNITGRAREVTSVSTTNLQTSRSHHVSNVTTLTQEDSYKTTETTVNVKPVTSMTSISPSSTEDQDIGAKTSQAADHTIHSSDSPAPSLIYTNTSPHASTAPAPSTSHNTTVATHNKEDTSSPYNLKELLKYISSGFLVILLICILFLVRCYFSRKRSKAKPVKAPFWVNANFRESRKTNHAPERAMSLQGKEEVHIYTEIDENPPLPKTMSPSKRSASLGCLLDLAPLGGQGYSTVEAVNPVPFAYSSMVLPKSLPTSKPRRGPKQLANSCSSVK
ncbi:uncharacterized protein [Hyperolius riggenbachi]|uniref:uncharacterized protein n=1 Tax=Hyperolius riggenbachi TaxID=752182 RepID=UPI0035A261A6